MKPVAELPQESVSRSFVPSQVLVVLGHGLVDQRADLLELRHGQRVEDLLRQFGQLLRDRLWQRVVIANGLLFL